MNEIREDFEKLFTLIRELEKKYGIIFCDTGSYDDDYLANFLPENNYSVRAGNKNIFNYGKMQI